MGSPVKVSDSAPNVASADSQFGYGFGGGINFSGSKRSQENELLMLAALGLLLVFALKIIKKG